MPPSRWTVMGALSKGRLRRAIMIRTFGRCMVYYFKTSFVFFFDFIISSTFFWKLSPKRIFCSFPKQWAPFFRRDSILRLSLNKAVNTLYLLKYNPLLWSPPILQVLHIARLILTQGRRNHFLRWGAEWIIMLATMVVRRRKIKKEQWLKLPKAVLQKTKFEPKYKWFKISYLEFYFWKYYFGNATL